MDIISVCTLTYLCTYVCYMDAIWMLITYGCYYIYIRECSTYVSGTVSTAIVLQLCHDHQSLMGSIQLYRPDGARTKSSATGRPIVML